MKTWEMIKELTENPDKEFISTQRNLTLTARATKSNQGIKFIDVRGESVVNIGLDREWEEVKEPLSFLEVLEVVKDRCYAYITLENQEYKLKLERHTLDDILTELSYWGSDEIADILLKGEFYISD